MSNYLNAVVNNEFFYILPVCNLLPYNSNTSGVGGISGNTNTLYSTTALSITIPDYVKNLDIDYISFGASPNTTTQLPSNVVVAEFNINSYYEIAKLGCYTGSVSSAPQTYTSSGWDNGNDKNTFGSDDVGNIYIDKDSYAVYGF